MAQEQHILNELKGISPAVGAIPFQQPTYQVPLNYFEQFAERVLHSIYALQVTEEQELETLAPLLNSIPKTTPYQAPLNYFEWLPDNVVTGAKAIAFVNEELENLSPLMNSLRKKNVYQVPNAYFDTLAQEAIQTVKKLVPAKVVSFKTKIIRFAVAASLLGIVAFSGWWYTHSNTNPTTLRNSIVGIEKEVKNISDAELEKFSNNTVATTTGTPDLPVGEEIQPEDVKDMLADVSDEELQVYLEQHNGTKELINN